MSIMKMEVVPTMEDYNTNFTDIISILSTIASFDDEDCYVKELNFTDMTENSSEFFNFFMYGVLLNIVGVLGLLGNIISITILSRSVNYNILS